MKKIIIKIDIGKVGESANKEVASPSKEFNHPQIQFNQSIEFNECKNSTIIRKMQSLEQCFQYFQEFLSIHESQVVSLKCITLWIVNNQEDRKLVENNHAFCQIQNKIIQSLLNACPFVLDIRILINGFCTCIRPLKEYFPSCDCDVMMNLRWKFLSTLSLCCGMKAKQFKALALYPYKYLTILTICWNHTSNKVFLDLSRAQWPSIVQLYWKVSGYTADGLKVLKKHCFHKLQFFGCTGDDIGCEKGKKITQTTGKFTRLLLPHDLKVSQSSKTIQKVILRSYVVKTKLLKRYLTRANPVTILNSLRYTKSNECCF